MSLNELKRAALKKKIRYCSYINFITVRESRSLRLGVTICLVVFQLQMIFEGSVGTIDLLA